ncbi:prepilin-type N-terminal cleavage/methylation domain-containing protein [Thioflavicoccus mobilis 8321]|uniref:Type II secretion system protein H n=1 Tax=Thioflavicoccus mobilis 8321 TaxID=765912 RepID=L0H2N0_9GAMM|nr:prepilin-type N-terminal cleavage/methylation domain-containing protein [Thioflavicoccus mobilis 8321]
MRGVTLIELVVTLSIVVILLTIAVPSFQNAIATNRIAALTNELSTALQLARSEAVNRGRTVTVCKSDDLSDSTPSCNTSADWEDGWVVFVDTNDNGALDSGELPLRVGQPSSGDAVVTGGTNFADYVRFRPDGSSRGSSFSNGTLSVCIVPNKRDIVINTVGRLRIEQGSCP